MSKPVVAFTFANHMHWVDMEWLWGYHVLPGSIRDMLHYCRELGIKGGVNFDGVGYEKLAAEDPESLQLLREAVLEGTIEPVGCSYGQPYGLFHGGESNVRQLIYGARSVRRLLGVWPKTFWEEEFYFFPQLPQMLTGCGFTGASLYFQWTWHTPEVPFEEAPVVWWEGHDGTRMLTATRNKLNLHQWPEDVDTMLAGLSLESTGMPLVQQWVELMPSPDWMCRSEVLIPKMREFLKDERFEVRPMTLGKYLDVARASSPVDGESLIQSRRYGMDDVWHGLTLGKNGDDMRRRSRRIEDKLVSAEAGLTFLSLLGRPYPQWDVYPVWEFEEAWRRLLRSQHHDNCECEGLCAHVAKSDYEWLEKMCIVLGDRLRPSEPGEDAASFNPNGWSVRGVEPFGFGVPQDPAEGNWNLVGSVARYESIRLCVTVDLEKALITNISSSHFEDGVLREPISLVPVTGEHVKIDDLDWAFEGCPRVLARVNGNSYFVYVTITHDGGGVRLFTSMARENPGKGGYVGSNRLRICPNVCAETVWIDTPYAVSEVAGKSSGKRKYPSGDWMTSPQWFEEVEDGLYASTFLDFREEGRGLLIIQDSPTQWFRNAGGFEAVIGSYDPWDEHNIEPEDWKVLTLIPHGKVTNSECWRRANQRELIQYVRGVPGSFLDCESPNVVVTALFREAAGFAGKHVENYAFPESFQPSQDGHATGYPVVMRLVEFDGLETVASLTVAGQVARAYKTNLLGQIIEEISVTISEKNCPQRHPHTGYSSILQIPMRPHEIATIYLDILEGRKVARDLDAKREVWAQVHRT